MSSVATGVRVGDPRAVVVDLHERYARQIQRFCAHRLGSREEAEDATQLTFINAFRGLERGASLEFESAWLFKIAENVCQNSRRSSFRRRRIETPTDLDEFQDVIGSPDHESDELWGLSEALQDLPELQRRAILLREWQGLSYKEIAAELELSQAAVETLLFRARGSLAENLTGGSKRRTVLRRGDLASLLAALKDLLFGGVAKLAATAATVVVTSILAVGSEVPSADASHHGARAAHARLVGATGATLSPPKLITRERSSAPPAAVTLEATAASPNPPAAAVTWPSLFPPPQVGDGGPAATAPSAESALPGDPAGSSPPDASPPPAPPESTAGSSSPATTPDPKPSPDQGGAPGSPPAADSTPSGDTGNGSTSAATDAGSTSTAPPDRGSTTPASAGGGKGNHRSLTLAGPPDTPGPPDGVGAKADAPGQAQASQARADHPQPPADPPGQAQDDHPQPPAGLPGHAGADHPQPVADPIGPG